MNKFINVKKTVHFGVNSREISALRIIVNSVEQFSGPFIMVQLNSLIIAHSSKLCHYSLRYNLASYYATLQSVGGGYDR